MRLISTLILVILTIPSLLGQYKSVFGTESSTWSMILFGICDATTTTEIQVIGDTLINGYNYQIINRYEQFSNNKGFLREDTTTGRIWFLNPDLHEELLTVDLSLSQSDTFSIIDHNLEKFNIKVDTVFYNNGLKHIRFHNAHIGICDGGETLLEFIEGTGSNAGLFSNINGHERFINSYLLCHKKDGVKVYGNTLFNDTCFVEIVSTPQQIIEPQVKIYPNPSDNILCIELLDDQIQEFSYIIYNSLGEILVVRTHLKTELTVIDMSKFNIGIYIIKLYGLNDDILDVKKFVKH